jgi:hypothetical protein
MVRLVEIFHWMFEDERWRYKILFQGLILLIPVVGVIAMLGWTMATCDNLLSGGQDLARTGLYLRRGVKLLAIGILYWIALSIPYALLLNADASLGHPRTVALLAQVYNDVALGLYALLFVPVLVATDRRGFLGGIDIFHIAASILARPVRTIVALLVVTVAAIIGMLGFALIIAAPFTITYAASVTASVAAWWSGPIPQPEVEQAPDSGLADFVIPVPFRPPPLEPDRGSTPER